MHEFRPEQRHEAAMKVVSAVASKPPASPVTAVRASQYCQDYWFLGCAGGRDLIPMVTVDEAKMVVFEPPADAQTAMAHDAKEIGQLAVEIAQKLKEQTAPELLRMIDVVIVCTAGIDSPFGVSIAGKIQHIFGVPQAFPFTIGQMDGCSAFEALRVARAFIDGPEQVRAVAIIATECWRYPYFRSFGNYAQYGDGAAALLLCADHVADQAVAHGGDSSVIKIGDLVCSRYREQRGPFDTQDTAWFRHGDWARAVGRFLAGFLQQRGIAAADLAGIHSPSLNADFIQAVAQASDLPLRAGEGGFVSSVDPLLALQRQGMEADGEALCWSVGLNGEMGACLYRKTRTTTDLSQETVR
jgi:3-oxoacyl-[acyl-carrier-protein] synthase III